MDAKFNQPLVFVRRFSSEFVGCGALLGIGGALVIVSHNVFFGDSTKPSTFYARLAIALPILALAAAFCFGRIRTVIDKQSNLVARTISVVVPA